MTLTDVNLDTGEFAVRGGKGRKDRTGYLLNGAQNIGGLAIGRADWPPGPLGAGVGSVVRQVLSASAALRIPQRRLGILLGTRYAIALLVGDHGCGLRLRVRWGVEKS